jgi:hypothetical protein
MQRSSLRVQVVLYFRHTSTGSTTLEQLQFQSLNLLQVEYEKTPGLNFSTFFLTSSHLDGYKSIT